MRCFINTRTKRYYNKNPFSLNVNCAVIIKTQQTPVRINELITTKLNNVQICEFVTTKLNDRQLELTNLQQLNSRKRERRKNLILKELVDFVCQTFVTKFLNGS